MRPSVYTWDAQSLNAICALQNTTGAGNLILNGTGIVSNADNGFPTFTYASVSRTVSLTSANNLSASNFTITGTYRGSAQSETIAGPNANTVETTVYFDSVTQISVNGAVNGIRAGTGTTGFTRWFWRDNNRSISAISIQVEVINATVDYTFQITLDNVNSDANPATFNPLGSFVNGSTSQFGGDLSVVPFAFCRLFMNSSDATGSLRFTVLQSGIN